MTKYPVAKVSEIKKNGRIIVEVKGMEIGIFHVNGEYFAWRNFCPHAAAPICKGRITGTRLPSMVYEYKYGNDDQIIRCPWHGWEFNLETGQHLAEPDVKLRGYPVEVDGEDICLLLK
ncbi:Rieske (2Fe-2S) protein [Bacillus sp. Marseille-P3661]|uniref:Rieske (2Fe-2S) protein n=1 Tax=Bacillus sp. Marseille-P3661 TaxID=1936234 RepID=UPI000C85D0BF|nr:Rieske (2Fe-2S) protein [Bacillus sp. Marseille-P3661]